MSNWEFLEKHRVTKPSHSVPSRYVSDSSFGFNGIFRFRMDQHDVRCVCSDGAGWQHVSVSFEDKKKTPPWSIMCKIKDLFWDSEDCVMQLHPRMSKYVNMHPGCLHLWRPLHPTPPIPEPDSLLVGIV